MRGGTAWATRCYAGKTRSASRRLTLEHLAERADHAGRVRFYSRRQLGAESGVGKRMAVYLVRALEGDGWIATDAEHTERGAQLANSYRVLAPWIAAQVEGEQRAAELPATRGLEHSSPPPPVERRTRRVFGRAPPNIPIDELPAYFEARMAAPW